MNGGSRIIALDGGAVDETHGAPLSAGRPGETAAEFAPMADADSWDAEPLLEPKGPLRWIVPGLAALLLAGWTVLFAMAKAPAFRAAPNPDTLVNLTAIWVLPVMLVLMCVLIARTTLRDASRHAVVIRALADESRQLESRLRAMNTELSLARDFIAAQGRDLESLGRIAVDRLSGSAERLKDLIAGQGRDMDQIGTVAAKALENISTLRAHLPVISNSAKDAANAIAHAGHTADTHRRYPTQRTDRRVRPAQRIRQRERAQGRRGARGCRGRARCLCRGDRTHRRGGRSTPARSDRRA